MTETKPTRATLRTNGVVSLIVAIAAVAAMAFAVADAGAQEPRPRGYAVDDPIGPGPDGPPRRAAEWVRIMSKGSLVHAGSNDSFAITAEGTEAARLLLDALETGNPDSARAAIAVYQTIVPRENYGGEYTALEWFARYRLASEAERADMLADPFVEEFFNFFGSNDFAVLKEYLNRKYRIRDIGDEETLPGQTRKALLEDTILFNNPRREEWEQTSRMIQSFNLQEGQTVADVGSGPGYFTTKFAHMVGSTGHIFAIDTVDEHLSYLERVIQRLGMQNVEPIHTDGKTLGLSGQKVDVAFMCSLYHNIYAMTKQDDRDSFVESIRAALKDDGRLIVVDNALVEPGQLPYHGPYIAKELIIGQLMYYGFELEEEHQFIPQRYVLIFRKVQGTMPASPGAAPRETAVGDWR